MNDANAAIYFAADGYDPSKGINGRRMAGESFILGFLRHAAVPELACYAAWPADHALFKRIAASERPGLPVRHVERSASHQIAEIGTLYIPTPNFAAETWVRASNGAAAWSICGITHTMSTRAVIQGMFDLRMSDQQEWDAVICTSRPARSAVLHQFELADEHIRSRFAANPPPRPQLPVIPLGVNVDDFAPDEAGGAALRESIGAAATDVVFAMVARLSPLEKFDPLPMFLALRDAAGRVGGRKLHLILCGNYANEAARKLFEAGAAQIMPAVGFHVLSRADAEVRLNVLSAADVYVFPIDNVQETFGIAPVEAMAAGLPLIVSDWDGLRDTVSDDVGMRIPTITLDAAQSLTEARRFLSGLDTHAQYCGLLSAMTRVDVGAMAEAMVTLALDPELRRRMGRAGQARARALYDWARIVPQMQELWSELSMRRRAARPLAPKDMVAAAPPPFHVFKTFPTAQGLDQRRFVAVAPAVPDVAGMLAITRLARERFTVTEHDIVAAHAALVAAPEGLDTIGLAEALAKQPRVAERLLIWLLKYDFARPA